MYMQALRSSRPTSCDFNLSLAVDVWLYEAWLLLVALLFSYSHALQSHICVYSAVSLSSVEIPRSTMFLRHSL